MQLTNYINLNSRKDLVDVIIPLSIKDINILDLCIYSIRKNFINEIKQIYLIADNNKDIIKKCKELNIKFIYEYELLGFKPDKFNFIWNDEYGNPHNRNGWLYQQIIKLYGNIGTCENYVCVDGDLVFTKPILFLKNNIPIFYISTEQHHNPYYKNIYNLTGIKNKLPLSKYSYITDKMIFNNNIIKEIKTNIEIHTNMNWINAIEYYYDNTSVGGFSEYELYGNFCRYYNKSRKEIIINPINNIASIKYFYDYNELIKFFNNKNIESIVFPSYMMIE